MTNNFLVTCIIASPLLALSLQFAVGEKKQFRPYAHHICSYLFLLFTALLLFNLKKPIVIQSAAWQAPFGISMVFDSYACLLLFSFALISVLVSIYSLSDNFLDKHSKRFYVAYWLLMFGVVGIVTTGDIFNLYVWLELTLVAGFILLGTGKEHNTQAVFQYAVQNILGTLLLLLAIGLIYALSGSLNYADIAVYFHQQETYHSAIAILTLLLFGFTIKGGLFPSYYWLPKAYPTPSSTATLTLASLSTKAVMVVMLRLFLLWTPFQSTTLKFIILSIAVGSMFFGVMGAATQFNCRRILSFHIISQLGYVVLGIVIKTKLAIIALIYFLIHNIFVKTNLLMVAGRIEKQYGTGDLKHLGGIMQKDKLLSIIFFLSAFSLAGLPPFSGFWGKFFLIKAAIDTHFYWAAFFAVFVSLFTLYSMIKIWRYAFCRHHPEEAPVLSLAEIKSDRYSLVAMLATLTVSLIMGFYPNVVLIPLQHIANHLMNPNEYIHLVLKGSAT